MTMHKRLTLVLLSLIIFLTGCDYSKKENQTGIFYNTFVKPMDGLLHFLGRLFHDNYGLAIIVIVLIVRFILLPLMLIQVKNMHMMREKTKVVKPELDAIREKIKNADSQEERNAANQLLMKKYKSYGINPFKNMIGCLPVIIQIPILMGLYMSLKYPTSDGITKYPHFLWFNLTEPNLIMTIIAASMYFIQPLVNSIHYPKDQRTTYYVIMVVSPIFITYASLTSASALGLYWSISAGFLIIQMHFAHSYYGKLARQEAANLKKHLNQNQEKEIE
ncbi:membrane protein insertase, YidC/Oxa1 family [Staphylococcus caprae M23864:W1]|nr:membrane protein insertase, YidC/Oxa1 family [Staphylococcus caprae M23864:W1]